MYTRKFTRGVALLVVMFAPAISLSQDIVITNPNGLNALWNQIPDNGTVREGGPVTLQDGTQHECAALALRRFKRNLNNLEQSRAISSIVSGYFSALSVVVPGGYAKYAFTALKTAYAAYSAESPEEFKREMVKEAIKQIGSAGIRIPTDKTLETALGQAYEQIIDAIFKMEPKSIYDQPISLQPCSRGSINITLQPAPPDTRDTTMRYELAFTIEEDCECRYPEITGGTLKLKSYRIWGTMPVTVTNIEFEDNIIRSDKIKLTMAYGAPVFNVSAECDCGNISYTPNTFFAGVSTVFEDAGSNACNLWGLKAAYVHMLATQLAVTGDASFYVGSISGVKYTRLQLLLGVAMMNMLMPTDRLSISPHVLLGISNLRSKYAMNEAMSNANFTAMAGTDVSYQLNPKTKLTAKLDYNPVFSKGGTANNFVVSAGVSIPLLK
ncbi:MAG: hypothetical protein K0Q66_908 [Chitinophagaceae bacterium]|jgi:hypothetical protein|nr:hypothetical protein [Chitinophagaceae bacterium]